MQEVDVVQRSVNITRTQICVDDVQNGEPLGYLYNPYMPDRFAFFGYLSLVNAMDDFFDQMKCPKSYNQYRTFAPEKPGQRQPEKEVIRYMAEDVFTSKTGEKTTFTVQVQFRQNSTWQGTIAWMEGKKIQQFRSALEMIKLMDNALAESSGSDAVDWE
ncbi:MAG: hypothetical protein PHE47_05030 [Oscillospiraceae bacterium]|nr:hypothetical protein [Oscillospiraceae bacterium]